MFESFAALSGAATDRDAVTRAACATAILALEALATGSLVIVARLQRAHALAIEALCCAGSGAMADASARHAEARAALEATLLEARSSEARSGTGDVLLASRLAQHALAAAGEAIDARQGEPTAPATTEPTPSAPALVIATSGRWFRLPTGEEVDCARHRTLRRVLICLARSASSRRGVVVTTPELLAAVWPDERPSDAARNRLKTLVSKLRRLGLRDVLLTDPDGYLLDGLVAVRLEDDGPGRG